MLVELALSSVMVTLTAMAHGLGLLALARLLQLELLEEKAGHIRPVSLRGLMATLVVVLGLFGLHGAEIWGYAILYDAIGAVHGFRESLYFSTITYAAIGYDDRAMAESWRLVSAIEGINGILLIGWSTAFFTTRISRIRRI